MHSSNNNGSGKDNESDAASNVVPLRPRKSPQDTGAPMVNLPPFTKWTVFALLGVHLVTTLALDPEQRYWVIAHFGFVPALYTGGSPVGWPALAGPFTYALLHGGWGHVLINTVMLAAFGAGLERWMGWKRMALFMLGCSLVSALVHLAVSIGSDNPVIGASGAISGMFAAAMIMLRQRGDMVSGRYGLWPFILLWIGISVAFGAIGGPGGENIAWAAHIGGFLAGFILIKPIMRVKRTG